jgi:4-hydroxybenzoate polyprenyltransferase
LNTLTAISDLIRLDRQYGTLLLMAPALWSLVIASGGAPAWSLVAIFALGAFVMRSAGCVANDLADRRLDALVSRTRSRPLACGRLSIVQAVGVFAVLVFTAFFLILPLNSLTQILSLGGLALAILYPFAKRVTFLPQTVMGVAFGWGALMAWAAARNELGLPAMVIFAATIAWAAAYDTIYALQDCEDDRRVGVKSTALLFGRRTWMAVGVGLALAWAGLFLVGWLAALGPLYYAVLLVVGILFLRQTLALRRGADPPTAFRLFRAHALIGKLILAGIVLDYFTRNMG